VLGLAAKQCQRQGGQGREQHAIELARADDMLTGLPGGCRLAGLVARDCFQEQGLDRRGQMDYRVRTVADERVRGRRRCS
jgi:hypothetical protein